LKEKRYTVGLITLSLERERTDLAEKFGQAAATRLRSAGFAPVGKPGLVFDTAGCLAAAKECESLGADCILILLGTWVATPTVVDTVRSVNLPFGVWAEDNAASFSLTAGGIVHGSLDELGLPHRFFYGSPDSCELIGEIGSFIRASAAGRGLTGERLCVLGGRVMGMYTTMADIIQMKNTFGVEIEHMDAVRLYFEAEKVPEKEVAAVEAWLRQTLGKIDVKGKTLERSIRLYIALKAIMGQTGYDLLAVKCQDEMINEYASSCLAVSLLNDEGYTLSCESDIYAAITMRVLSLVSGGIALFGDVNHLDVEKRVLRVVNCGSMPTLLARARKEVDLGLQYEYMGRARGATTVFSVRESPVTLARLSRVKGEFVMLAVTGKTQTVERSRLKESREYWPHAFVELDCDAKALVQNIRSNHMHLCMGNHLKDLEEFCRIKGIRCIKP
jgi:L-fucose isomerase